MKIAALVAAMGLAAVANAQVFVSQNFDALAPLTGTGSPTATLASPFSATTGVQAAITNLNVANATWSATRVSGTGTVAVPFFADNGSGGSGGIYSYGTSLSDANRALGSVASGTNIPAFGVEIVNTSSVTLNSFTFSFDAQEWRKANGSTAVVNSLAFAYGFTGLGTATSANYLTDSSLIPLASGNVVGTSPITTSPFIVFTALGTVNVSVSGLNVAPGQSIFLRWQDTNDLSNDAGLAIDNFSFSAIPTPGTASLMVLGGLLAARRRRA